MHSVDINFIVTNENDCPLYKLEDKFKLAGNALFLPGNKPACLILAGDITGIIEKRENFEIPDSGKDISDLFNCSGCGGIIGLKFKQADMNKDDQDRIVDNISGLLSNFSMFKTLSAHEIKEIVSFLKLKQYSAGEFIIKKGDPGENLFIITAGAVEVLADDNVSIAFLGKGEVFGEMSLLSGEPVGATIKVIEPVRVLYLNSRDFRRVLHRFSPLQMYLARLLSKRLAKTNVERSEEFATGIVGRLSETPPSELVQTFNLNQKTGVLTLELTLGIAELCFRKGGLIYAKYMDKENKEAFFEILKENDGRYKFMPGLPPEQLEAEEIGHFMCLLMEGLSRMDEKTALENV